MKFFWKFFARAKSDSADSLVTAVLIFPLVVSLIATGVDFGMFMNNKSLIQNAARDGARTVSILGGNSDNTVLAKAYGSKYNCGRPSLSSIECETIDRIGSGGLVQVSLMGKAFKNGHGVDEPVNCSPEFTSNVGQQVYCEVFWMYDGLPLSSLGFIGKVRNRGSFGRFNGDYSGLGFPNRTVGYAAAETTMVN